MAQRSMSRATKPKCSTANCSATESETSERKVLRNWGPTNASAVHEFGGPLGMLAMMVGFPLLMYVMWIGAVFYDGQIPKPGKNESFNTFVQYLWFLIKHEAYPTRRAWRIYWSFGLTQLAFYILLPGVYRKGQPVTRLPPSLQLQPRPDSESTPSRFGPDPNSVLTQPSLAYMYLSLLFPRCR